MRVYEVQLEVREGTLRFEVATDNFDAVDQAKAALEAFYGKCRVHVGGYSETGFSEEPYLKVTGPANSPLFQRWPMIRDL